jgi:large repetitive protein
VAIFCQVQCNGQGTAKVDFNSSIQSGCEPLKVQFTSVITYPDTNNKAVIVDYVWDFGDGTPHESGKNPVHIYHVTNDKFSQQYSVMLKVIANTGYTFDTIKLNWIQLSRIPTPIIIFKPINPTISNPKIQFDVDSILSRGIHFNDTATKYSWSFGDNHNPDNGGNSTLKNPEYSYTDTGRYIVKVFVKSNGCQNWDSVPIRIYPQLLVFIPNVFRPDGRYSNKKGTNYFTEKVNQTFQPIVRDYSKFQMSIFSSEGELYYQTTDPNLGWPGDYNGQHAPEGVYYYIITVNNLMGKEFKYTGNLTLIR